MQKLISSSIAIALALVPCILEAAPGTDRRALAGTWGTAQHMSSQPVAAPVAAIEKSSIIADDVRPAIPPMTRDAEKKACINNNIGVGNTFVWASKFSNSDDYTTMVEDTEFPENNTCFVKVEMKSSDAKVNISDIRPKYFEMGRAITCGSWTDSKKIESKILDAKKSARTWGTVAGAVGGAGIGVGAMELFGNKLIGGSVEGQFNKNLSDAELLRSQLLVAKEKDKPTYNRIKASLAELKKECESDIWKETANISEKPAACDEYASLWDI
ncbi:MAG: hypothetical protein LBJ18_02540 [Rickettsiales bacterium]|jgi:hypothetical protein|nr:hypothetical protein [Rickettsiales bacterium]